MDPWQKSRLGRTSVAVPALGLGTAPLGGWPRAVSAEQARATIETAWAAGIRHFDTAPFYGHGLSEQHLGGVLPGLDRSQFTISTKVGRLLVPGHPAEALYEGVPDLVPQPDFTAPGVLKSLAESRERLALERIDMVLIHDPDDAHEEALREAYPALAELRAAGEIGAIGVGMNWSEPLARFAREADFDCFLLAGRYTLLEQGALDELMPAVAERGASVIAGGVLNSGVLVDPRPGATYNYAPAPEDIVARAAALQAACAEFGVPLRAAAMQFPLAHPQVPCVVLGARTPAEVADCVAMMRLPIPGELWAALKERDLLRADAPVPA
jgi:aryl-alcohol dehydrogenase-like predicted oxidoreductase